MQQPVKQLIQQPIQQRGFTLLEVLVAMVILQVGVLSLMAVIPLTQIQVAKAETESQATQLLRQQLESLARHAYDDSLLVAGGPYTDPDNPIGGRYDRTWTVVDDLPISGCKTLTVQVAWDDQVGPRQVVASTVLARY